MKHKLILVFCIIPLLMFSCKPEEIILHADLTGLVTDALTDQPLEAAKIKMINANDSTLTGNDGTYLLRNIAPGNVEVESSKYSYITNTETVKVNPAETTVANFELDGIPVPILNKTYLDFGSEETRLTFTISYHGPKRLTYVITPTQDWITSSPVTGQIIDGTDTITVILNRSGLPEKTFKENINITSVYGKDQLDVPFKVYLNGVVDQDGNYYNIVRIGNQTWMAENLNVGIPIIPPSVSSDNNIIEKLCTDCSVYGGFYYAGEMMQYNPRDNKKIGTTRGVCPNGWHIPTINEWHILDSCMGSTSGIPLASSKYKEIGSDHWHQPYNNGTDDFGFTALPSGTGYIDVFGDEGESTGWWSSSGPIEADGCFDMITMWHNDPISLGGLCTWDRAWMLAVRCIKDP